MPVYFARAGQDGLVKIGYAIDVAARIRHLQCGLPFDLVVVREVEGSRRKETAFHRHFRHLRVRGEWFRWDDELLTADVEVREPEEVAELASQTVIEFLSEIERFCAEIGISESTFSKRFANDGKFVRRLKAGADLRCDTLDRARAYMAERRAAHRLTATMKEAA